MTGEEEGSRDLASFGWKKEGEMVAMSIFTGGFFIIMKNDLDTLIFFRCKAEDSCLYPHPR